MTNKELSDPNGGDNTVSTKEDIYRIDERKLYESEIEHLRDLAQKAEEAAASSEDYLKAADIRVRLLDAIRPRDGYFR